jgi:hypothetical protein
MAEIVNLRRARKAKARSEASATGDANRVKHGAAKKTLRQARAEQDKMRRYVEAKKLDSGD